MTEAKLEEHIRRLKQIGEHETAELLQGMWEGLKSYTCSSCVNKRTSLMEEPCASCVGFINWEWEGWTE